MMILAIAFPDIDPIALEIGPLVIRWYSLAYIAGLMIGWRYCLRLAVRPPAEMKPEHFDDFLLWATLGVLLGGRVGYVLFYKPGYYLEHPLEVLFLWHGGMSFHGGLAGVIVAMAGFAWRRGINILALSDIIACAAPLGLFFGRLANFINGELFGRPSSVPWAMVFPHGGPEPRHPSQLYEAGLEGLVLFTLLYLLVRLGALQRRGLLSGIFLAGYGLSRMTVELFRQPDQHLGFLFGDVTMGQLLSLPMLLCGLGLVAWSLRGWLTPSRR
jgi:phosphatidylglycerol:prolipoprotein diacylglycerol transferase